MDRDTLLQLAARVVPVEIDGIGTLYVRELTALESAKIQAMSTQVVKDGAVDADATVRFTATLVLWGLVDEHGNRIFRDDEMDTVMALPGRVVDALAMAVLDASNLTPDSQEQAKKGSVRTHSNGSSSD